MTLPRPDAPLIQIASTYVLRLRARFLEEGKLIAFRDIHHPDKVTTVSVRLWRSEQDCREWLSDPIVKARAQLYDDHYKRNGISLHGKRETL